MIPKIAFTLLVLLLALAAQADAQKLVYSFDEVEVLYAARFTLYPTSTSVQAWVDEIAAPGEKITATYGIVILKSVDDKTGEAKEVGREEWLKVEGKAGSKRLLSNSISNSFDTEQKNIISSKTQLWSVKKLIDANIEKDFTEPIYNAYLFRELKDGKLAPKYVCFRSGGNFDDFWAKTSTEDCYTTERMVNDVGDNTETAGAKPALSQLSPKDQCPERLSCLTKKTGESRGCVVLASYACASESGEVCFNCGSGEPSAEPLPTSTIGISPTSQPSNSSTPTPSPAAQCVFTGSGCCYVEDHNKCVALPPFVCGPGLVAYVTGCVSGGCQATFKCEPVQSAPSPTYLPSPSNAPTLTPSPTSTATPSLSPTPVTPSQTPIPDSCTDSDGGFDYFTSGSVTGFSGQKPYTETDFCQDSGGGVPAQLIEWICAEGHIKEKAAPKNCADFNTESSNYTCVGGACAAG